MLRSAVANIPATAIRAVGLTLLDHPALIFDTRIMFDIAIIASKESLGDGRDAAGPLHPEK
jgi:hypothetical protein